jgi:ribosomal protein S19
MVRELQVARIYGGMHFRTSTVHGKVLGTKVGKWVSTRYFRPVANR